MYDFIALPLDEVEKLLKLNNEKYIVRHIKTFKLKNPDTCAVVKTSKEEDITVLHVCDFMCEINKE